MPFESTGRRWLEGREGLTAGVIGYISRDEPLTIKEVKAKDLELKHRG